MKKDIKLIIAPIVLIIVIALGYYALKGKKADQSQSNVAPSTTLSRDTAYVKGAENAKVKIVEFFDPECEGCAGFHPILMKVLSDFPNDVSLEARYMLFHGNSYLAAMALEGAGKQGKYWELYNILLERQSDWSHKEEPVPHIFEMYAKELDLDVEAFNQSYDDISFKSVITRDMNDGKILEVRGTPTLFINGKRLERLSYNDLKLAVEAELK